METQLGSGGNSTSEKRAAAIAEVDRLHAQGLLAWACAPALVLPCPKRSCLDEHREDREDEGEGPGGQAWSDRKGVYLNEAMSEVDDVEADVKDVVGEDVVEEEDGYVDDDGVGPETDYAMRITTVLSAT